MIEIERHSYDQASTHLANALTLKPDDPFFLNNRGYLHLLNKDLTKAKEDIDLSISLDPYNGWAYRNKGLYYLRTGNTEDAIRLLAAS